MMSSDDYVLKVRGLLGIGQQGYTLRFPQHQATFIFGRNAVGKSSLAAAASALLTRSADPVGGLAKGEYINDGGKEGDCTLQGPKGRAEWSGKSAVVTEGDPPEAHLITGNSSAIRDLLEGTPKAKIAALLSCFDSDGPDTAAIKNDLRLAVSGNDAPAGVAKTVADVCVTSAMEALEAVNGDWSAAEEVNREKAREHKRAWQDAFAGAEGSSATYGTAKAANYTPSGWRAELDGSSISDAEQAVSDARDVLEGARVQGAVSAIEKADAEKAKSQVPAQQKKYEAAKSLQDEAASLAVKIKRDRDVVAAELEKEKKNLESAERFKNIVAEAAAWDKQIAALQDEIRLAKEAAIPVRNKIQEHENVIDALRKDVAKRNDRTASLIKSAEHFCPHCEKPLAVNGKGGKFKVIKFSESDHPDSGLAATLHKSVTELNGRIQARQEELTATHTQRAKLIEEMQRQRDLLDNMDREKKTFDQAILDCKKKHGEDAAVAADMSRKAISLLDDEHAGYRDQCTDAESNASNACAQTAREEVALTRLQEAAARADAPVADPDAVGHAEDALKQAERDHLMVAAKAAADEAHHQACLYEIIAKRFSQSGLRAEMMAKHVTEINLNVAVFCSHAQWPEIVMDERTLRITVGGRNLRVCSGSEKWRAQIAVQFALAIATCSDVLLIDGADVLDDELLGKSMDALRIICREINLTALVFSSRDLVTPHKYSEYSYREIPAERTDDDGEEGAEND